MFQQCWTHTDDSLVKGLKKVAELCLKSTRKRILRICNERSTKPRGKALERSMWLSYNGEPRLCFFLLGFLKDDGWSCSLLCEKLVMLFFAWIFFTIAIKSPIFSSTILGVIFFFTRKFQPPNGQANPRFAISFAWSTHQFVEKWVTNGWLEILEISSTHFSIQDFQPTNGQRFFFSRDFFFGGVSWRPPRLSETVLFSWIFQAARGQETFTDRFSA